MASAWPSVYIVLCTLHFPFVTNASLLLTKPTSPPASKGCSLRSGRTLPELGEASPQEAEPVENEEESSSAEEEAEDLWWEGGRQACCFLLSLGYIA